MPLFRDIPPPSPEACVSQSIDWAANRDPVGHRVHLGLAIFAMATIPLSSSLATISSTLLMGYAILRAPTLWRTWRTLPRNPCILLILALFAWLAISILWSPDSEHGIRLLRGSRYLLLVPALLPLMRHAHLLLLSICAGVFLQNAVQFFQYATTDAVSIGGLDGHPGNTGLWFTLAIGILLSMPGAGTASTQIRRASSIVPALGIILSAARSVMLGGVAGLIALIVHAVARPCQNRRIVVLVGLILVAVLVIPSLDSSSGMGSRVRAGWKNIMPTDSRETTGEADKKGFRQEQARYIWWRIGLDTWKDNFLLGAGLGSAENQIRNDSQVMEITEAGTKKPGLLRDDYHSLYITVAATGGTIGFLLLVAWLGALGIQVLHSGRLTQTLLLGFTAYLVYSAFNTTIFSGQVFAFAAVLMAFSTHQLPEQYSLSRATAPEANQPDDDA